jgi:hypothetical protein
MRRQSRFVARSARSDNFDRNFFATYPLASMDVIARPRFPLAQSFQRCVLRCNREPDRIYDEAGR